MYGSISSNLKGDNEIQESIEFENNGQFSNRKTESNYKLKHGIVETIDTPLKQSQKKHQNNVCEHRQR